MILHKEYHDFNPYRFFIKTQKSNEGKMSNTHVLLKIHQHYCAVYGFTSIALFHDDSECPILKSFWFCLT